MHDLVANKIKTTPTSLLFANQSRLDFGVVSINTISCRMVNILGYCTTVFSFDSNVAAVYDRVSERVCEREEVRAQEMERAKWPQQLDTKFHSKLNQLSDISYG